MEAESVVWPFAGAGSAGHPDPKQSCQHQPGLRDPEPWDRHFPSLSCGFTLPMVADGTIVRAFLIQLWDPLGPCRLDPRRQKVQAFSIGHVVSNWVWVPAVGSHFKRRKPSSLTSGQVDFGRMGEGTALQPSSVLCLQELHWGCVRP